MATHSSSLEIVTLTNPLSDRLEDNIKPSTIKRYANAVGAAWEAAGRPNDNDSDYPMHEPLADEFDTYGEQFARLYAKGSVQFPVLDAWQKKLGSWMSKGMSKQGVPEDFREWWHNNMASISKMSPGNGGTTEQEAALRQLTEITRASSLELVHL